VTSLRKSTKADHIPPDMEEEIMAIAPDIGDRLLVRVARLSASLWLDRMQKERNVTEDDGA
jgi:hypothetical protein